MRVGAVVRSVTDGKGLSFTVASGAKSRVPRDFAKAEIASSFHSSR